MDFQEAFGKTIKNLRKQRGITQKQLSIRTALDRSYISELEAGSRNIALANLRRLAIAFDLTLWEMLRMTECCFSGDEEEGLDSSSDSGSGSGNTAKETREACFDDPSFDAGCDDN